DSNVQKINAHITTKVADKLSELFKTDRKGFEEKWKDISLFVKYGMLSDDKFAEKANDFCLVRNTAGEVYTLKEYAEKVKDIQRDKEGNVVYLYTNDAAQQDGYIATATGRGYDVLVMDSPIDSHFVAYVEQKAEKTQLKRVDADVIDKLIQKEDTKALELTEEESKKAVELFEKAISRDNMKVAVEALSEHELPVTVTIDEFMRRMKDMAQTGGGMSFYGTMPDNYKVTVNGNHPLVKRILSGESEEEQQQLAKQAFDLALLSRGLLTGNELTNFVKRSVSLIG